MKKQEALQLHILLDTVAKNILKEENIDQQTKDFFPAYNELNIRSTELHANSKKHQQAVKTLSKSISDFTKNGQQGLYENLLKRQDIEDEIKINVLGNHYKEQGLNRKQAAQKLTQGVDYKYHTVYDKFTNHGIRFSDHEVKNTKHGEEKRRQAIKQLEKYREENIDRSEALTKTSNQTGIDKGTLKNWLTKKDIKFTEELSALIEPESKKELIDTAEHYFNIEENRESIEQALGYKIDTLRLYRDDKIKSMPVELLDRLDNLFNSEPKFRMDKPDRYIEDDTRYGLKIDDEFQKFLFSHIKGEDLEGMTGQSSSTLTRYRNNRTKTVDQEAYRKAFQAVSHIYNKHPEPEIKEYVHKESFRKDNFETTN